MEMASWTIQKGPGHHHGILQPNTAHLGLSQNVVPIHWWITPSPFFLLKLPSGSIGKTWKNYSLFVFLLKYRMFKPNCPSTWHQNQVIPMSSIPHWANLFLKALLGGYRPSLLQRYPHMLITWLLHDYYIVVTRLSHGYYGSRSDKLLTDAQNRGWISHDHLSCKLIATGHLQKARWNPVKVANPVVIPNIAIHGW